MGGCGRPWSRSARRPNSLKTPRARFRRLIARLVLVAALAASVMSAVAPSATADIGVCPEVKPPRTEAQALGRGFAFDGVVVGGRTVRDPSTGREVLVSPLTFRVIRNIFNPVLSVNVADYGRLTPSGEILITAWDATYAVPNNVKRRLKWKVLITKVQT